MDHDALEQEVKLEAGIGFRTPDLNGVAPGVTATSQPEQNLQAVYVDTADLRLVRSGLTLRHRAERSTSGSAGAWTLKLPEDSSGAGVTRREISWAGRWGPVPVEIAGLVRAYRRTAPLGPVARLVTHRRRTLLASRVGEPLLEIDDDVVSVMDGRRLAARFREVEVEVVGPASVTLTTAVVARLGEAGALPGDGRSKLARAIGYRAMEPPDVAAVDIGRTASMGEVVRAAIAHGYLRLVAHDLGVRLDNDPEDVHQARVATRRLRSDLRTFRAFVAEDWSLQTRQELGWLADALGRARDADVLQERLRSHVESLDARDVRPAGALVAKLAAERDRARQDLLVAMSADRYAELLDRLVVAARELPPVKASPAPLVSSPTMVRVQADPDVADLSGPDSPGPESVAEMAALVEAELTFAPGNAAVVGSEIVGRDAAVSAGPVFTEAVSTESVSTDIGGATLAPAGGIGATIVALMPGVAIPAAEVATAGVARSSIVRLPEPPSTIESDRDTAARRLAPAVVRGPWRHLARAVAALGPVPADEALHEVRIRAKRLRYACEAVAAVVGKPATDLARAAAELQGILGEFHDSIVAEQWLRAASVRAPTGQALAAGQLIAGERDDAARCRAEWATAWKQLDRKKLRAWLR